MTRARRDLGHVPVEHLSDLSQLLSRAAAKACVTVSVDSQPISEGKRWRKRVHKHHVTVEVSSDNEGSVRDYTNWYLVQVLSRGFARQHLVHATLNYMNRINRWNGQPDQLDI